MSYIIVASAILVAAFVLTQLLFKTEQARVQGIPEIPGWPIVGNLLQLGSDHAAVCMKWAEKYGPVFQVRMGYKRVIIANTYQAVKELWIDNQSALISRPMLYTFHTVVSSSQGFTIGTSPWDESCKQRRKAAATALNRPAVASYMPIVDLESKCSIRDIYVDSHKGAKEINPKPYFQRFALNTSLTLNYGTRMSSIDNSMLKEIISVEAGISRFRSTSNNWQDYLPILRYIPFSDKTASAEEFRVRRDGYMDKLLSQLKTEIKEGTDISCITGNILKDPEAKLNEAEIKSICLTMVSAGLDTVPANIIQGLAYLATPHGQQLQEIAFKQLIETYGSPSEAWNAVLKEEKVTFISALVKETLRYYTVIAMSLPRASIKPIKYLGATIPAGTLFYMNARAADFDTSRFSDPYTFNPDRYLQDKSTGENQGTSQPHYAYGAGSRMCAGSHLANRELYVAFSRMILAYKLSTGANWDDRCAHPVKYNECDTALVAESRDFNVRLQIRDGMEEILEGLTTEKLEYK